MRKIITVLSLVLSLVFICQCNWQDESNTCADHCFVEIITHEWDPPDEGEMNVRDYLITVTFLLMCDSDYSTPSCDGHLKHYRISYFRTGGGESIPPAFDIFCDLYIPCGIETSTKINIFHGKWYTESDKPLIKGYAVLQFWGNHNDGSSLYCETQIPIEIADWGD